MLATWQARSGEFLPATWQARNGENFGNELAHGKAKTEWGLAHGRVKTEMDWAHVKKEKRAKRII